VRRNFHLALDVQVKESFAYDDEYDDTYDDIDIGANDADDADDLVKSRTQRIGVVVESDEEPE